MLMSLEEVLIILIKHPIMMLFTPMRKAKSPHKKPYDP